MRTSRVVVIAVVAVMAMLVAVVFASPVGAKGTSAKAELRAPDGTSLGKVVFTNKRSHDHTNVKFRLHRTTADAATNAFHGFHIHANSDPVNGTDCVADASAAPSTWFVSADGHWSREPAAHSAHSGDMPSVLVNKDGSAFLEFTTQRIEIRDLSGKAVILHAGPDNFGNVPTGPGPDQYTANGPVAVDKTQKTGNAGDRIACGVIK